MADQTARPFATPTVPLVGREREQAVLRDALAAGLAGGGSLVLIGGEAGLGKTALAEAALAEAAAQGALVLVGRCYDLSETPPYGPWAEALARVPAGVGRPVPVDLSGGRAVASQAALLAATIEFLGALAARRPLVLLLDDLHWADPASLDLLRALGRALARLPILLLATYRTEDLTRLHPLFPLLPLLVREAAARRLDLQALDDDAVRAWLGTRYRLAEPHASRLVTYVQARAEGNPFFAGELLRALEEARLLRAAPGDAWALGDLATAGVPPLLRQVLEGRVRRLGEAARELLTVAAVVGQEVPLALWAAVAETDEDGLLETIERAVAAQLLVADGDGLRVRFAHALVRETLYEGLLPPRRRGWHRRVADALLARPAPDPDAVAAHLRRAGDPRAVVWLVRAGLRARRTAARLSAAERFAAAAALLATDGDHARERGWLLFGGGLALAFSDTAQSLRALDEAEVLALEAGDRVLAAHVRFERGRIRCNRGAIRRGLAEMAREVTALAALPQAHQQRSGDVVALATIAAFFPAGGHPVVAWPAATVPLVAQRSLLVNHLALAGRYREALAVDEQFLAGPLAALGDGEEPGLAPRHLGRGHAHAALGHPVEARRELVLARAAQRAGGDTFMAVYSTWFELLMVTLPYEADNLAARAGLAAEGRRVWARAQGTDTTATHGAQSNLPLALLEGRWAEARRLAEAALASAIVGYVQGALLALGTLARQQGEPDAAWARVRALHPDGPATEPGDSYFPHAIAALALAADLALDAGDLATAGPWIAAHGRWLEWNGAVLWQAEHQRLRARHARVAGDFAQARRCAEVALARASEPRQPLALLAAHRPLGELATDGRRPAEAARHLDAALALAEACAAPYERALTLLALAELRVVAQTDDPGAPLAEARATLAGLGATPALARADALAARLAAPAAAAAYPAGLTAREVEVLRLVAAGQQNRAIADTLFLSLHTVERHIANLYAKTGAHGRAAATAFAHHHRLA